MQIPFESAWAGKNGIWRLVKVRGVIGGKTVRSNRDGLVDGGKH
jgi:hypothetical protein